MRKISRILNPTALTCALREGAPSQPRVLLVGNSHADSIKHSFTKVARERDITVRFVVPNNPLMVEAYNADVIVDAAIRHGITHIVIHFSPGEPSLEALRQFIERAEQHDIRVDLIAPVPVWQRHIPQALLEDLHNGSPRPQQNITAYFMRNRDWRASIEEIPNPNFHIFDVAPLLCRPQCQLTDETGRPLYFDTHHLTLTGSDYLLGLFHDVLSPGQ